MTTLSLGAMGKRGPKPRPKSELFTKHTLSFPPELYDRIRAQAEADDQTVSEFVAEILERAVNRMENRR